MYVACGHCDACLNRRATLWVTRLKVERSCWRYCVFFTLTYAEDNCPKVLRKGDYWFFDSLVHRPSMLTDVILNKSDFDLSCDKDFNFYNKQPFLRVLSVRDVQNFMKRLRMNIVRLHGRLRESGINSEPKQNEKVRYYIVGEYGETTFRPHYHGLLFFNSEITSAHIADLIYKSWPFGIVDSSFVQDCNASYVAQYVNSTANLPSVLRHRLWRPFAVFSKQPPIGSLVNNADEIASIFHNSSPTFLLYVPGSSSFGDVPLWRSFVDKLFPKISRFNEIPCSYRTTLYGIASSSGCESYFEFEHWINSKKHSAFIIEYVASITHFGALSSPLQRFWRISSRVCSQADVFGVSVDYYVKRIVEFYENVEKAKLTEYFQYQSDSVADRPESLKFMSNLDMEWLHQVSLQDYMFVQDDDLSRLESYGIDLEQFFSLDLFERNKYRESIGLSASREFREYELSQRLIALHNRKTKRKNDYLNAHPELSYLSYE